MCGISGFVESGDSLTPGASDAIVREMNSLQAHRGPDDDGVATALPARLGHCRLAILDLGGSRQPMSTADQRYLLSFNGEIYNYRELRQELQAEGRTFRTSGDTEVLLQGFAAWGDEVVRKLRGMFAFAIWDDQRRRLFLARDHLGVKPLYYAEPDGGLVFASELKAVLSHPGVSRGIDLDAVSLYLESQYIPTPYTIYQGVKKLPPGHALSWSAGESRVRRYWNFSCSESEAFDHIDQAADRLLDRLRASVQSMMIADVPLGAWISGGIDSGLILALMSECSRKPVQSFHLGFQGEHACSEHQEAASVAAHLKAKHHCLRIHSQDLLAELDRYVEHYDEPFGDQAALPTMMLARLTSQRVKVVLSGEGADEVFGGYANYARHDQEERVRRLVRRAAPFLRWIPAAWRRDRYLRTAVLPPEESYTSQSRQFAEETQSVWYTREFLQARRTLLRHVSRGHYLDCDAAQGAQRLMFIDTKLWLPDNLLTKVDRATMAYSLEARVPYLDHPLVEFAARMPSRWKCDSGATKVLLKHAACRYLPRDLVYRKKQGFRLPLDGWLRHELADFARRILGPRGLAGRRLLRPQAIERLLSQHAQGRNLAGRIWTLMMLELWFQRYEPDFRLA